MSFIRLEKIEVKYGSVEALKGITIDIKKGEFLSLLGPSGCGKTTTIRVIAGFVIPYRGNVFINDEIVNQVPPFKRNIGVVFNDHFSLLLPFPCHRGFFHYTHACVCSL